jgi:hypothetical protein
MACGVQDVSALASKLRKQVGGEVMPTLAVAHVSVWLTPSLS